MNKKNFFSRISVLLVWALIVTNIAAVNTAWAAESEMVNEEEQLPVVISSETEISVSEVLENDGIMLQATAGDIIYDGNGSVGKILNNGKIANIEVRNSVITIKVDNKQYGYYNTICVAGCVISDDDMLHIFWHTGEYYVYDLYENGMFILAYKDKWDKYCSEKGEGAEVVKGSSAANVEIHSCLIDTKYFYQYGKPGKKALMTREEFQNIVNPATPTPSPTSTPTATPTLTPRPTATATPTSTPKPTATPTPKPTATPTAIPTKTPDVQIDNTITVDKEIHTEFDATFWWEKFNSGKITWEQLMQVVWQNNWNIKTEENETETVYYFYNPDGTLNHTERKLHSIKTEDGKESGTKKEETTGEAKTENKEDGKGGVTGTIDTKEHDEIKEDKKIHINNPSVVSGGSKNKKVISYSQLIKKDNKKKKTIALIKSVNGKDKGQINEATLNKKTGKVKYGGKTYKSVRDIIYSQGTQQLVILHKNGDYSVGPRGDLKGTYKPKRYAGHWEKFIKGNSGLGRRLSDKNGKSKDIRKAKGKKIR